jgi:hypothetical protein
MCCPASSSETVIETDRSTDPQNSGETMPAVATYSRRRLRGEVQSGAEHVLDCGPFHMIRSGALNTTLLPLLAISSYYLDCRYLDHLLVSYSPIIILTFVPS